MICWSYFSSCFWSILSFRASARILSICFDASFQSRIFMSFNWRSFLFLRGNFLLIRLAKTWVNSFWATNNCFWTVLQLLLILIYLKIHELSWTSSRWSLTLCHQWNTLRSRNWFCSLRENCLMIFSIPRCLSSDHWLYFAQLLNNLVYLWKWSKHCNLSMLVRSDMLQVIFKSHFTYSTINMFINWNWLRNWF